MEEKAVPVLIFISITLNVISLCTKNWIQGYYGDIIVLEISPWRLCHVGCLECTEEVPHLSCFWMSDWSDTGFDPLAIVAHLEYWTLALLGLGLITAIMTCAETMVNSRRCPLECGRPTVLVLVTSCLISTASVSLFGTKLHQQDHHVSNYQPVHNYFGWPFYGRVLGGLATWLAAVCAVVRQCRTSSDVSPAEDRVMVITASQEMAEDSADEAEHGALL